MPLAASTDAADRIPGAWVEIVEGAGHFTRVEAPGAVRTALRRLTQLAGGSAGAGPTAGLRSFNYHRRVHELLPGLWHWQAPHPGWEPGEPWDRNVSSYAIDDGKRLLIFDPIAPPSEIHELAAEREAAIVLTAPWHERDMQGLVDRFGLPVYAPRPDTAEDLMRMFGITPEQAGDGSPDLVWLRTERPDAWRPYAAGDRLPGGIEAFPGYKRNDLVLWIESHRAVIAGDTLADFGSGLEMNARWLEKVGVTPGQVAEGLGPLLALPVERVLATHGGPFDRAALERALSG